MTKILFLAGSAREKSLNKRLAKCAHQVAIEQGAQATFLDLRDYPLPLYDGDLEEQDGMPKNVLPLKELFVEHHGLFIASPEYNSSFSPLLKNTRLNFGASIRFASFSSSSSLDDLASRFLRIIIYSQLRNTKINAYS